MDWVLEKIEQGGLVAWPPVDVELEQGDLERPLQRPALVVWPHRWEHDKGPKALLELALAYSESEDLRWIILGESFRRVPDELKQLQEALGDRIEHIGYIEDRETYLACLGKADWVLSTADHEFYGIAVVEALLMGCLPWLPQRLSYPELLPSIAVEMSPLKPPPEPAPIRQAIRSHLAAARAPQAVALIDDLIEQMVVASK